MGNQALGARGENEAVRFLATRGFVILDRNWRASFGELDIVAKEGTSLVFVEVKARSSLKFGHPFEAVTAAKIATIRKLARAWCAAHPLTTGSLRIDVVSVLFDAPNSARVEHLRGVFA